MPANTTPIFPLTPVIGNGVLTTSVDSHTGANSILLATGGTNGSRIDRVTAVASGTTAATVLRLWISPDNGTTKYLYRELALAASTDSETAAGTRYTENLDLILPSGIKLYASIGTSIGAGTHAMLHVTVEGGDF